MSTLKGCLVSGFLVIAVGIGLAVPADAAELQQGPKVNISNFYGKPKIKVAKKLRISVSCDRDCALSVKGTLQLPGGRSGWSASRTVETGVIWFLTYKLTNFGRNYLRQNFRKARYVIRATATDLATGKKTHKTRTFRFSR